MFENRNLLAIVIPAYKRAFLWHTLNSISLQTNKNFTLYIGDDCSPYDINSIVAEFKNKIDIVYKRFHENLGGANLIAHWTRCIEMAENEEWVWCFADDDTMESSCVEDFYKQLKASSVSYSLYHYNVNVIDHNGKMIEKLPDFPNWISSYDFFKLKSQNKVKSYAVEYIFNKSTFHELGGFQNFDLAWGSDDATWIKLSEANGINTISGSRVYWRRSNENISPNISPEIIMRKAESIIAYYNWVEYFFSNNKITYKKRDIRKGFRKNFRVLSRYVSYSTVFILLKKYGDRVIINFLYMFCYKNYRSFFYD